MLIPCEVGPAVRTSEAKMSSNAENPVANKPAVGRMPEANKVFIGEGVTAREVVLAADSITVDGVLEGDITATNLLVNPTGTVKGRIIVTKNAEIYGNVLEKLDVKGDLILRSGSHIAGTISYGRLSIEQGANIVGEISSPGQRAVHAVQQPLSSERAPEPRLTNGAALIKRPDLAALDLMPGPFAATS
jgi:cytoskeletal protein CcmA (bactofilin family)